jgi:hypothetical protein
LGEGFLPQVRVSLLVALLLSLVIHAGLLALWTVKASPPLQRASTYSDSLRVGFVAAHIQRKRYSSRARRAKPIRQDRLPKGSKESIRVADSVPLSLSPEKKLASMPAPPAPSPEEWGIASTYTLKNSKHYRNDWGQLVRSMMGTAVEGPQQGLVRFHIEIAPDGKIAKVVVLWATSELAEKLAWKAIRSLPPLPPTPTGRPLVFEQTIAFEPFDTGWPPNYKLDYEPDTPSFHNPFALDAFSIKRASQEESENSPSSSPRTQTAPPADSTTDLLDQIDTEDADMNRQLDQWGRGRLNGVK